MNNIKVLDKGFVEYVSHMGNDLTVANAARVSFNKESTWTYDVSVDGEISERLSERDVKLIKYLAEHNHWTPFAHPQITLRIKAPISIRTQLFKHKVGFVENEVSRRYITENPEIYSPLWRTKPSNGAKQGSDDFVDGETRLLCTNFYITSTEQAFKTYDFLLNKGIAPEQARFVLPQGTYTEWWWTGSLSAYARVVNLRQDKHAQWEVREYSNAIAQIIQPLYPVSWNALLTP